jgi:hypothetical protein
MLDWDENQKYLKWRTHYLVHYKTTRKINNRKKDTPENRRVVWCTEVERFPTVEDAVKYAKHEEKEVYKIYRIEPTLVEEV